MTSEKREKSEQAQAGTSNGTGDDHANEFRPLAFALAWLWPGLGHVWVGERARGVRIMAGMLLLFFGGLFIGGIDAVDRREDTLWFLAQAGCGPLAFGADFANTALLKSGRIGTLLPGPQMFNQKGSGPRVSDRRGLAHPNEFGTLFIALAGLMNVAVMLDAGFRRERREPTQPTQPAGQTA